MDIYGSKFSVSFKVPFSVLQEAEFLSHAI